MKLSLEQFEEQWAENRLSVTDWFDTTYGLFKELETLQQRSCENVIKSIRNSFSHATVVYTRGSCGQLYKILKEIFPDAEAYENGDHIITKIYDKFWDIKGEVTKIKAFKPCKQNNEMLLNRFGNDLQYIQCPNCDEVFYCGDDEPKEQ